MIKKLANKYKLVIKSQINSWGKNNEFNCKLLGDYISEIQTVQTRQKLPE